MASLPQVNSTPSNLRLSTHYQLYRQLGCSFSLFRSKFVLRRGCIKMQYFIGSGRIFTGYIWVAANVVVYPWLPKPEVGAHRIGLQPGKLSGATAGLCQKRDSLESLGAAGAPAFNCNLYNVVIVYNAACSFA